MPKMLTEKQGASPPAIGWAISDSILLGSLYNYRLWLSQHGPRGWIIEPTPAADRRPGGGEYRLTILGHGIAGLWAGWTRYVRI